MYERGGISSYDDKAAGGSLGSLQQDGAGVAEAFSSGDRTSHW